MDNLKDFKIDPLNFPDTDDDAQSLQSSTYHQEINTLKIEKLSNRVTIISVIIPCLICAILAFIYLDMKERVVDVDETKQIQVEKMARQIEEKLNSLDLRIAKNKFDFDQQLPRLAKKQEALENQVAKMSVSKANVKTIKADMAALDKKIKNNAGQNKKTLAATEAVNQEMLASISKNNTRFEAETSQIKQDITLFTEEFDARLLELSAYEEQIGLLRKTTSILDKRLKEMELDWLSKNELDKRYSKVQQTFETLIQDLDEKLEQLKSVAPPTVKRVNKPLEKKKVSNSKPAPLLDTDLNSGTISEETLTE
jgi:chromosome segregation ATPase